MRVGTAAESSSRQQGLGHGVVKNRLRNLMLEEWKEGREGERRKECRGLPLREALSGTCLLAFSTDSASKVLPPHSNLHGGQKCLSGFTVEGHWGQEQVRGLARID